MEDRYNKIIDISFKFGVRIIKLFQYLVDKKVNFAIPNQILRSGTSIGANVNESVFAQSKKDFINKMHIALKEANETKYWLRLLYESGYINDKQFESMTDDLKNIIGTLVNIIKTSKNNN
ncbi:MAG: four helix bundle protein [Prevotella sp.]|nr:four helix bundle protein [Prevotella sp.]